MFPLARVMLVNCPYKTVPAGKVIPFNAFVGVTGAYARTAYAVNTHAEIQWSATNACPAAASVFAVVVMTAHPFPPMLISAASAML